MFFENFLETYFEVRPKYQFKKLHCNVILQAINEPNLNIFESRLHQVNYLSFPELFSTTQNFFSFKLSISLSGRAKWRHHMRQILISRGRRRPTIAFSHGSINRDERPNSGFGWKREVGACAAHITHMFMKKAGVMKSCRECSIRRGSNLIEGENDF